MKRTGLSSALAAATLLLANPATADRALLAPTGNTLPTMGVKYELAVRGSDTSDNYQWLHVGLQNVELQLVNDNPADASAEWGIGVQGSIFPGTASLPAISAGVRDILDDTRHGRAYYVATGTNLPSVPILPRVFSGARLDAGLGADGIKGAFASLQLQAGQRTRVITEFDSRRLNFGVDVALTDFLRLRGSLLHGDAFYGLMVTIGGGSSMAPDFSGFDDLTF